MLVTDLETIENIPLNINNESWQIPGQEIFSEILIFFKNKHR